jgi:hypothetical protein
VVKVEVPNEIPMGKLVLNHVLPHMNYRFDAGTRFRCDLEESKEQLGLSRPPGGRKFKNRNLFPIRSRLPGGYKFKIVATMTTNGLDGPQLAQLR